MISYFLQWNRCIFNVDKGTLKHYHIELLELGLCDYYIVNKMSLLGRFHPPPPNFPDNGYFSLSKDTDQWWWTKKTLGGSPVHVLYHMGQPFSSIGTE